MRGADWSKEEVAATVADYFRMLRMELSGQLYNKTMHRRELLKKLNNRSDASVELKHRNISAALIRLGVMPIKGYKPLFNFQRILFEEVERALIADLDLDSAAIIAVARPAEAPIIDTFDAFVIPPPTIPWRIGDDREQWDCKPTIQRDYLQREANNQSLGSAGERTALEFEVLRLRSEGKPRLADKVEHCSRTRGDGLGFDILSFETNGRERFIEVKTTAFGAETPFFLSEGERLFSATKPSQFQLYRIFDFRRRPRMYVLPGSVDHSCRLNAVSYLALPASSS